jgi:hypothetical protein
MSNQGHFKSSPVGENVAYQLGLEPSLKYGTQLTQLTVRTETGYGSRHVCPNLTTLAAHCTCVR